MKNLLFLVHRIPFPPNKGDKIRSYHFLKYLSDEFNVYLGTFVDDPDDWQYTEQVDALCAGACYQSLQPIPAKIKSLQGLMMGNALSLPYYQNRALQTWVDELIEKNTIHNVLVFSSVMARFIKPHHHVDMVVDFVDVDSDKWRQYAEKKHGLARWVYRREAKFLLAYERQLAARAQASLFVSKQEATLFKTLAPEVADKVDFVNNGVDTDYFSPHQDYVSPYQTGDEVLVFTGAMDYWANIDAVVWFAKDVFPQLQADYPMIKFYIVGSKPGKAVLDLADNTAITVTGRVEDVRPYVAYARLAIAPLRIARGIQNKVLEAMAMDKTIIATPSALEGIPYQEANLALAVSDDAKVMAGQLLDALQNPAATSVNANRDFVIGRFSWQQNVHQLAGFLHR